MKTEKTGADAGPELDHRALESARAATSPKPGGDVAGGGVNARGRPGDTGDRASRTSPFSPWLTSDQAAAYLGIKPSSVRSLVCRKQLRACKPGRHYRFHRDDLDEYVRGANVAPSLAAPESEPDAHPITTTATRKVPKPSARSPGVPKHAMRDLVVAGDEVSTRSVRSPRRAGLTELPCPTVRDARGAGRKSCA